MIIGCDYLAGSCYEELMLQMHPFGKCAGIFLRTFKDKKRKRNDSKKTVAAMCECGIFSEIVIHLSPFSGSHNYPISALKNQVLADCRWAEQLQKRYPKTQLLLSPFCENHNPAKEMAPLFKSMKQLAPSCLMVNSILEGGEEVKDVITEIHLEDTRPRRKPRGEYIVSFDGFGSRGMPDFFTANLRGIISSFSDARQIRGWNFRANGLADYKDHTPLDDRTHWPDAAYIAHIFSKF